MQDVASLFTFISNAHYFYSGKVRNNKRSPLPANAERLEARQLFFVN